MTNYIIGSLAQSDHIKLPKLCHYVCILILFDRFKLGKLQKISKNYCFACKI